MLRETKFIEMEMELDKRAGMKSKETAEQIQEKEIKKFVDGVFSKMPPKMRDKKALLAELQEALDERVGFASAEQRAGFKTGDLEHPKEKKDKFTKKEEKELIESLEKDLESRMNDNVVSLRESSYNSENSEITFTLSEGTSKFSAEDFVNKKIYSNRPTRSEKKERPERNLKDWCATIIEAVVEKGKIIIKAIVHDDKLKELFANPVSRRAIGFSIDGGNVNLVTEPGAGGGLSD